MAQNIPGLKWDDEPQIPGLKWDDEEKEPEKGVIEKWENLWINKPLIEAPSRWGKAAGESIDLETLRREASGDTNWDIGLNNPYMRGFASGALEGLGNLASGFTSPLNIATLGAFKGASLLGKTAPQAAKLLHLGGRALSAPVTGTGVGKVYSATTRPFQEGEGWSTRAGEIGLGLTEAAGGLTGIAEPYHARPRVPGPIKPLPEGLKQAELPLGYREQQESLIQHPIDRFDELSDLGVRDSEQITELDALRQQLGVDQTSTPFPPGIDPITKKFRRIPTGPPEQQGLPLEPPSNEQGQFDLFEPPTPPPDMGGTPVSSQFTQSVENVGAVADAAIPAPEGTSISPDGMIVTITRPDAGNVAYWRGKGFVTVPGLRSPEGYGQMARSEVAAALSAEKKPVTPTPPVQPLTRPEVPGPTREGHTLAGDTNVVPNSQVTQNYIANQEKGGYKITEKSPTHTTFKRFFTEEKGTSEWEGWVIDWMRRRIRRIAGRDATSEDLNPNNIRQIHGRIPGEGESIPVIPDLEEASRMDSVTADAFMDDTVKAIDYWQRRLEEFSETGDTDGVNLAHENRVKAEEVLYTLEGRELPPKIGQRGPDMEARQLEIEQRYQNTGRAIDKYRLPDGRIIPVDATATKGEQTSTFQLKGGEVVNMEYVGPMEPRDTIGPDGSIVPKGMDSGTDIVHPPNIGGFQHHRRPDGHWVTHPFLDKPQGPFPDADAAFDWALEYQETPEFRRRLSPGAPDYLPPEDKWDEDNYKRDMKDMYEVEVPPAEDKFGPQPEIQPADKWDSDEYLLDIAKAMEQERKTNTQISQSRLDEMRAVEQELKRRGLPIPGTVQGQAAQYRNISDQELYKRFNYWNDNINKGHDPSAMERFDIDLIKEEMQRRGLKGEEPPQLPPFLKPLDTPTEGGLDVSQLRQQQWEREKELGPQASGPRGIADPRMNKPVPPTMGQQELPLGPTGKWKLRELPEDANVGRTEPPSEGIEPTQQELGFTSEEKNLLRRLMEEDQGATPLADIVEAWGKIKKVTGWSQGAEAAATSKKAKEFNWVKEALAVPTNATTMIDLSAPGRQGLSMILTPEFWKASVKMFQGLNYNSFKQIDMDLRNKPIMRPQIDADGNVGKSFAEEIGTKIYSPASEPGPRAEATASRWLEMGIGQGKGSKLWRHTAGYPIRATNRAFITFLNHLNINRTEKLLNLARDMSIEALDTGKARQGIMPWKTKFNPKEAQNLNPYHNLVLAKEIAEFVNTATGHGPLKGHYLPYKHATYNLEKHADLLSKFLFSPGLLSSRARMMNPSTYFMASPFVRKQYAKAALSTAAAWYVTTELMKYAAGPDAEVNNDPTSADFGKVRVGDTRMDLGGGFLQFATAYGRAYMGGSTSSSSGEFHRFGSGYQAQTQEDMMERFFVNKLNPVTKFAWDVYSASEYNPFHVYDRTAQLFVPLFAQDLYEINKANPELLPIFGPAALFGGGTQTYGKGESVAKLIPEESDWLVTGGGLRDLMPWNWANEDYEEPRTFPWSEDR